MKLIFSVTLLVFAIQLIQIKPSEAFPKPNSYSSEQKLVLHYDEELRVLAQKISGDLKDISNQLLQDQKVKHADTVFMKEFQKNITRLQNIYPLYVRYGLNDTLIAVFSNTLKSYYQTVPNDNKDFVYIQQLLKKNGYDALRDKYKSEFTKFVSTEFLPKYEELKSQISNEVDLKKFENRCSKWVKQLRECEEYECFINSYNESLYTPKERLYINFGEIMEEELIFYYYEAAILLKNVLEDSRLSVLSPASRQQLTDGILDFIEKYESTVKTTDFGLLRKTLFPLLESFVNESIPLEERKLIAEILKDHGLLEHLLDYANKTDGYSQQFFNDLETYLATLTPQQLEKEKKLLEWLQRTKHTTTIKERIELIQSFLNEVPFEEENSIFL